MIRGLFGPSTLSAQLRGGLAETSATHKAIAARVANALQSSSAVEGTGPAAKAAEAAREADLQTDMTELADTQLRYEADAKLLAAQYARLRAAVSDHA
jgi:flagellar basal body rod protein FlgB